MKTQNTLTIILILFIVQTAITQTPGTVKWKQRIEGGCHSIPVIGQDGTLYFTTFDEDEQTSHFYSVQSDSIIKEWPVNPSMTAYSSLSIGTDSTIYFCSKYGKLSALQPDSTVKWTYDAGYGNPPAIGPDGDPPAIGPDGTIYFGTSEPMDPPPTSSGNFYSINQDGTQNWSLELNSGVRQSPAIGEDGTIYVASDYGTLYALNPDGTTKWSKYLGSDLTSPAIGENGIIYIASSWNKKLVAVNPDGTINWSYDIGDYIYTSPAIGPDGTIYIGSYDNYLYAIDPDGKEKWRFITNGYIDFSPVIGSDHTIYCVTLYGKLYAINPSGTVEWQISANNIRFESCPIIRDDGLMYITSYDGYLYAIWTSSTGLADSPWPKLGKNDQNQSNSYNPHFPRARVDLNTQYANSGSAITLDGSLSYDPDGDALSFSWECIERPPQSTVSISNPNAAATQVMGSPKGKYIFNLTVSDNKDGVSYHHVTCYFGVQWVRDLNSQIAGSPAIDSSGTIYAGTWFGLRNGIHVLNPDGTEKWSHTSYWRSGYWIMFSLSVDREGSIYATTCDAHSLVFNPDGTEKWSDTNNRYTSPAHAKDGTLYLHTYDKNLIALNPDGSEKWTLNINEDHWTSKLVIGKDGVIYCGIGYYGTQNNELYAVNPDGTEKWSTSIDNGSNIELIVGFDEIICITGGNFNANLYTINLDGTEKWSCPLNTVVYSSPVIDSNGTIYFGAQDHHLYAINPDGTEKWTFATNDVIQSTPAIGADGVIYVGSEDHHFYALNPDGTLQWSFKTDGEIHSSPSISPDGVVYFGSDDKKLYAIQTTSMGLADSPWPKDMGNSQNTSRYSDDTKTTSIDNSSEVLKPIVFHLDQNYPNPFNPNTTIRYSLPTMAHVSVMIYNILGQHIRTLVDKEEEKGYYEILWDGRGADDRLLESGVYILKIEYQNQKLTQKMMLIK